jgi:glycine cleavage system H protein
VTSSPEITAWQLKCSNKEVRIKHIKHRVKKMSDIPQDLKYTSSHEWVRAEDDGTLTVGITEHAESLLGDMVFVELPDVGDDFEAEQDCAVVESVKAASDIYCPVEGQIVAVNEELEESPEQINVNPYYEGWIFRIKPAKDAQLDSLMAADEYAELVESEAH